MTMTNEDGDLLLDAIEIERQRNRMMRQAAGFRHAVVDARSGELLAVMRDHDDAYQNRRKTPGFNYGDIRR